MNENKNRICVECDFYDVCILNDANVYADDTACEQFQCTDKDFNDLANQETNNTKENG